LYHIKTGGNLMEATGGKFLVIATDTLGREEEIGGILMRNFFSSLLEYGRKPQGIFLLNSGVRLATTNPETIPLLQRLVEAGVRLLVCTTCLKYFGLEDQLQVGEKSGMMSMIDESFSSESLFIG